MRPFSAAFLGSSPYLTTWPLLTFSDTGNPVTVGGITYSTNGSGGNSGPYRGHDSGGADWIAAEGVGAYWRVKFDSPRKMTANAFSGLSGGGTGTFDLQGSNDGVAWTTIPFGSTPGLAPYLYFQLICTAGTSGFGNLTATFTDS